MLDVFRVSMRPFDYRYSHPLHIGICICRLSLNTTDCRIDQSNIVLQHQHALLSYISDLAAIPPCQLGRRSAPVVQLHC
jgi:hypothetical protein